MPLKKLSKRSTIEPLERGIGRADGLKIAGFYSGKKGKKRPNRRPLLLAVLLLAVLLLASFAAGMLTHRAISRPPQPDAGLSYIEDIPVYTDFLPEGSRARPGEKREIKYLVIHETDNFSAGATAAAHNSFIHQNADAQENIVSWHYTVDAHGVMPSPAGRRNRVPCGRPDEKERRQQKRRRDRNVRQRGRQL